MNFIGIITSNKNEETLKKALLEKMKNKESKINIININEENIENIKNIRFDIIILNKENGIVEKRKQLLKKILNNTKYLIINSDIYVKIDMTHNLSILIITYGYNLKATLTTSSINNKKVLLCLQRALVTHDKNTIEPREIYSNIINNDIYATMAVNVVQLIYN